MRKSCKGPFNLRELIVLLLALTALAVLLVPESQSGGFATAFISVRGENVITLPLHSAQDQTIYLMEEYGVPVTLEVQDGRIRFVNVVCPDLICVRTGWVHMDGQSAVCMPNRTAVVIAE